ncbi:PLDc N-terminal domain-containing protein [Viridibacillus sp. YIM B01967]|uniref:PLDc N-terminal domain-containing protein n=1 Tax=Viridibacillus soli TaxID=2798301 RepID=A0ABS1HD29_9BACL|nr:PLDc N-terminal domain-containing protein [Viridibacillus soli]MBK3497241.1 PLDc N-terminal domain-containing protein [Viridibacillus soli]
MQLHYGVDELKAIDWMAILPIILPFMAVGFILILIALIDLYRNRKTRKNIFIWTLLILLCNIIGPVLYFVIGRKDGRTY